ncbi:DNApol-eta [Bugula neritina]|uniref:DNApol-eta n=1 Tax=Bugula neritina TaxID=10212 RepID=A0A7J7JD41_BUGNE|nr:DNApol-eta [Bugula neritina]
MMDGGNLYFNTNFSNKESQRKLKSDIQSRIVALIDMDCFYVQVEQRLAPEWKGKPCVVVQYNEWKGGGIIAVGYEARAKGVTRRGMRGDDAKQVCPDVKLFSVPEIRGKADLTRYREAGAEVISVLTQFTGCRVERASIDEAYIDLTDKVQDMMSQVSMSQLAIPTTQDLPHTFVVGSDNDNREDSLREWLESLSSPDSLDSHNDLRLCFGAVIVEKMRKAVRDQTGFDCSAGISHNKVEYSFT